MAKRKSKKQKRQAERKRQLRLEAVARHTGISASTTPSSCSTQVSRDHFVCVELYLLPL